MVEKWLLVVGIHDTAWMLLTISLEKLGRAGFRWKDIVKLIRGEKLIDTSVIDKIFTFD